MTIRTDPVGAPERWLREYVQSGDPDAAGRLFDATAPALFRVGLTLAHDAASAEDALQETFLAALEHAERFEEGRLVLPWLMGILRRKIGRQRREAARRPDPRRLPPDREAEDPIDAAISSEDRERVHAAIEELPEPQRSVAVLRWQYGLQPAEIAHARSEPPGTVRSLLHRAAKRLEESLGALSIGIAVYAGRGLDAVRDHVVSAATELRPTSSTAQVGTAAALLTGGLLMGTTQKVLVGAAALALVLGGFGVWSVLEPGVAPATERTGVELPVEEDAADRARARVGATVSEPVPEAADSSTTPAPVDLSRVDRDRDLHGRVVDTDGDPVGGARLAVVRHPWRRASVMNSSGYHSSEPVADALSATDGTFSFALRRGALVSLSIEADGFATESVRDAQAGERLEVVLAATGGGAVDLIVQVTDADNSLVPGATVHVFTLAGQRTTVDRTETADDNGRARFDGFAPHASLQVEVGAAGRGSTNWIDVDLPGDGEHVAEIEIPRGRTITGLVSDADTGQPIGGAIIGMNWTQKNSVRSAADGRYELFGWTGAGVQEIAVTAAGYGRQEERVGKRDHVDVELRRGDAVTGRLLGPTGEPVSGALVAAVASDHSGPVQTTSFGHFVSDASGRFLVDGLRRDLVHTLVITAEGVGRTLIDFDPRLDGAGTIDLGDIALAAGLAIEGVVRDADGVPIPGVTVTLEGANADRGRLRNEASPDFHYGRSERRHTDDLGRFRFPDLAPGTYTIAAVPRGAPQRVVEVELRDADVLDVSIEMGRSRELTVTVIGPDGKRLEGMYVLAMGLPGRVQAETDADGRCTLMVESGRLVQILAVSLHGGWGEDVVSPPAQQLGDRTTEMTFRFERGKTVRARVLDPDGEALAGVLVELHVGGEHPETDTTDDEGRIAVSLVDVETVDLVVTGRAMRTQDNVTRMDYLPVRGELRGLVPGGDEVTVRCHKIALDRTLTVHVTGPDGVALPNIRVWAFDSPTDAQVTDDSGTATLTGLAAEECSIAAFPDSPPAPNDWLPPKSVLVDPGGQTVTMVFVASAVVTGTVMNASGDPVVGARVRAIVNDDRGYSFLGRSDDAGAFSIRVPAGAPPLKVEATWTSPAEGAMRISREGVTPGSEVLIEPK